MCKCQKFCEEKEFAERTLWRKIAKAEHKYLHEPSLQVVFNVILCKGQCFGIRKQIIVVKSEYIGLMKHDLYSFARLESAS